MNPTADPNDPVDDLNDPDSLPGAGAHRPVEPDAGPAAVPVEPALSRPFYLRAQRRRPGARSTSADLPGVSGRLARALGLDIYGPSPLLTPAAAASMGTAAVFLLIVYMFETTMWALQFNMTLQGGHWDNGVLLAAAAAAGATAALLPFHIEKAIVTSDYRRRGSLVSVGMGFRLLCIAGSAWIVSRPLDAVAFGPAIERWINQDAAMSKSLELMREQGADVEAAKAPTDADVGAQTEGGPWEADADAAEVTLNEALARQAVARSALARATGAVDTAQATVVALPGQIRAAQQAVAATPAGDDPAALQQAERRVANLQGQYAQAPGRVAAAKGAVPPASAAAESAAAAVAIAQSALDAARGAVGTHRTEVLGALTLAAVTHDAAGDKRRLWVQSVMDGSATTDLAGNPFHPYADADFGNRMLVLDHILEGEPPRWPADATEAEIAEATALFGIRTPDMEEAEHQAKSLTKDWWGLLAMAFIIPGMALGYKAFLSSEDAANYYSVEAQAGVNNADAARTLALRKARE